MGQNCVAGTTEFDEENGIGLVMYVESGSNMIVWKMSDGTKQGTTVPVSSEYKNMLRTAFENKTGTRIGYFVFHPYTEESINIESSITINSGDAPEETLYIAGAYSSLIPGSLVVGKLIGNTFNVYVNNEGRGLVADSNGLVLAYEGPNENASGYIKSILSTYNIESVQNFEVDYGINTTIPNWANYEVHA